MSNVKKNNEKKEIPIPVIEVMAHSTITNVLFQFPADRMIISSIEPEVKSDKSIIVEPCKVIIPKYDLCILFNDNKICLYSSKNGNEVLNIIDYFLMYKTYMNYNAYFPPSNDSIEILKSAPEVNEILFHLDQIVLKEFDDGKTRGFVHDAEPCTLTINKKSIEEFLLVMNQSLCYAICYYLIGCENPRYFLVEYYKCVEVIANYFDNGKDLNEKLEPHGFIFSDYKKLKRYANDQCKPLSIGRHAPQKDVKLIYIDMKYLFDNTRSKNIFEESSNLCRNMIEAFIQYLVSCLPT